MPFETKPPGKAPGHRSRQQDMAGLLHDQPCCGDGVKKAFEGSDGTGAKLAGSTLTVALPAKSLVVLELQ